MSFMAIETAPKDIFLLGINAVEKRPFVMICSEDDEAVATHWMHLPRVPKNGEHGDWLSLDNAPLRGFCLGYDECLKQPFVMSWKRSKGAFVAQNGMGDETPILCHLIPEVTA
jgi:hypothetical protein